MSASFLPSYRNEPGSDYGPPGTGEPDVIEVFVNTIIKNILYMAKYHICFNDLPDKLGSSCWKVRWHEPSWRAVKRDLCLWVSCIVWVSWWYLKVILSSLV